ncbi:MAG: DNA polymerase III subunit delta [Gammaproteobacteria bacterium]|nr:DNA polymerase III subunit delta [Gammaproteobacteria bacterium]
MRVRIDQLPQQLERKLAQIYLLTGDEPLQMSEAADTIRAAARKSGYSGRERLEADAKFDWNRIVEEANNLSLFSEQRILELHIPNGKPGREGGKALVEYAERPAEDILLLITLPKLDKAQFNSKWFKALDRIGTTIQIWPIDGPRLNPWIEQRMRSKGLTPAPQVVGMLAERVEGNLLAAAQEIDKLLLLNGAGVVSTEQLLESVADSARFNVFGLVDSALEGQVARSVRILNSLRSEGIAAPIVLWALARELRTLTSLANEMTRGRSAQQVVGSRREIWDKRKPLVTKGLQRLAPKQWRQLLALCAQADSAIKGQSKDDPWLLLQEATVGIAGAPLMPKPNIL